ncbi:BNR-4 repeat-containing protein [Anaerophaga thermohalophila]|uniref:BNR-4 repeat-containing protein n=1 Tax=Anaerophaga thermohalophila TaxID=177400 RepID=UPI0002F346F1|nr:BNR-4 repeat-containing protein [Anaerophaga thermohalophila]
MKKLFRTIIILLLTGCTLPKEETKVLSDDSAWCWFSDPRAIVLQNDGNYVVVSGGVSEDGSITAFSFDPRSEQVAHGMIHPRLEVDDHNNPAFLEMPDGHILAFYTRHHNEELFMSKTLTSGDITEWEEPRKINPADPEQEELYGKPRYTYANPFLLSEENNRIYLFGRWTGFKPTMSWSDNGGQTWSKSKVVVCPQPFDPGNRPYVKYFSDGRARIHMTFTDGHPRVEPTNSVYYAYYEDGIFYRANGAKICTVDELPFQPSEATMVYDGTSGKGRAWVYDIKTNEDNFPVILYASYPSEEKHIYHYASFDGNEWMDAEICNSGRWFPKTPEGRKEREPHYSGGLSVDWNDASVVYLSRMVDQTFEIERWKLNNESEWTSQAVTTGSELDQVRPVVPWGLQPRKSCVLWMENERYIHYTDFSGNIKIHY